MLVYIYLSIFKHTFVIACSIVSCGEAVLFNMLPFPGQPTIMFYTHLSVYNMM